MLRKMIAILTSVLAALMVVGVAWAASDDGNTTSVTSADSSTSTSAETATSITSDTSGSSTPTTSDDTTSTTDASGTTLPDSTSTSLAGVATTPTSSGATTSTTSGATTSTSFDDSDVAPPDGTTTYAIPGLGSVTIEVRNGSLVLIGISTPAWQHEVEKVEFDRIEIEFESGDAEAEFEARIDHGRVAVKSKVDSD